jgi:cyclohexyl-isocyanide hydratase
MSTTRFIGREYVLIDNPATHLARYREGAKEVAPVTTHIGMLLYPRLTQLDLTAPFELFHRVPDSQVHLLWKDRAPVVADSGLGLLPTTTLSAAPPLDVVFVPGGSGVDEVLADAAVLDFLGTQGARARYVTSVCTGALVLGAAGLLRGFRAATHWAYMDLLPIVGAIPTPERVVVDRNRITAGGVTAGVDFGLRILAELAGERFAKSAQLAIEYDPAPPFRSGHPREAERAIVEEVERGYAKRVSARAAELRRRMTT